MEILTRHYNDVAILSVNGRLDSITASRLLQAINEQISAAYVRLVIDLKQVDFLNSAGIKVLVQGSQLAREQGGDFRLANAPAQVKYVLNLAGLESVIKMYANVVGATASYFPGPISCR
jgi:anti-sigma B factor antagonist